MTKVFDKKRFFSEKSFFLLFLAEIDNDKKKEKFFQSDKNAPKKTFFPKKCQKEYRFQDFSELKPKRKNILFFGLSQKQKTENEKRKENTCRGGAGGRA